MQKFVVTSLSEIHAHGETHHSAFVLERIATSSVPIYDTMKRNNMLTFVNRPDTKKKGSKYIGMQRQNMALVTQLFLSPQSRPETNMTDLFRLENHREPQPCWSWVEIWHSGMPQHTWPCNRCQQVMFVVLGMTAVIYMVSPATARTFSEYVSLHTITFIEAQMNKSTERIDAVWDNNQG